MIAALEKFSARDIQSVPRLKDNQKDSPRPKISFTREEFRERLDRMRRLMEREKIDLLHVTGPDSMVHFHGYNARYCRGHGPTADPPIASTVIHVD